MEFVLLFTLFGLVVWGAFIGVLHQLNFRRELKKYRQACRDHDMWCDEVDRRRKLGEYVPYGPVPALDPYFIHRRGQKIP
jgi:hypothetical protein